MSGRRGGLRSDDELWAVPVRERRTEVLELHRSYVKSIRGVADPGRDPRGVETSGKSQPRFEAAARPISAWGRPKIRPNELGSIEINISCSLVSLLDYWLLRDVATVILDV